MGVAKTVGYLENTREEIKKIDQLCRKRHLRVILEGIATDITWDEHGQTDERTRSITGVNAVYETRQSLTF